MTALPPAGPACWVVATSNRGKVREIEAILAECGVSLQSLAQHPPVRFPEEGGDYAENALAKARSAATQLGVIAVSDDSGLEVRGLDWGPGAYSARYGGGGLDDTGRVAHLLEALREAGAEARDARFVCVAALAQPDGTAFSVRGECRGRIAELPRPGGGFGYDPVFLVEGRDRTMSQLSAAEKNRISHRARAFRALWDRWCGEGPSDPAL